MLTWLRRRSPTGQTATKLYGHVVAQARSTVLYASYHVPDTAEGRFEMIVLHLFMSLERLRAEGEAGQALGQALLETFVTDMDDAMREFGIGDLGVPRRIKKTTAAVAERVEDYRAALAAPDDAPMQRALAKHIALDPADASRLATYARAAARALARAEPTRILAGEIAFPQP